ncbi:MAG TPA: hypothetical protein VIV60_29065 [Polyangiaceae bacterium]
MALIFAVLGVGCGKPLTRADCDALLQRYVSLLAASDRPETNSTERAHMQELAKEKAARDPEFGRCSRSVSRTQFDCAMLAPSTDDFERCLM